MIISSGEFLQDDLPGLRACMLLKLLTEIAKMPPKKVGPLYTLLNRKEKHVHIPTSPEQDPFKSLCLSGRSNTLHLVPNLLMAKKLWRLNFHLY